MLLPRRSALKAYGLYELSSFDQRRWFWAKSPFDVFLQTPSGTQPQLLRLWFRTHSVSCKEHEEPPHICGASRGSTISKSGLFYTFLTLQRPNELLINWSLIQKDTKVLKYVCKCLKNKLQHLSASKTDLRMKFFEMWTLLTEESGVTGGVPLLPLMDGCGISEAEKHPIERRVRHDWRWRPHMSADVITSTWWESASGMKC